MICIITGDIVNSQRYTNPETWLVPLKNEFLRLGNSPESWDIYRGDSFQLKIAEPQKALLAAIRIKASIKKVKDLDVRMALGFGEEEYLSHRISESNGGAYVNSGELFDTLENIHMNLAVKTSWDQFDKEINLYLRLLLPIIDNWSTKSAELISLVMDAPASTQINLAADLGIAQSSVSERQKRAYVDEILEVNAIYQEKLAELVL